jgi:hypothetical protein
MSLKIKGYWKETRKPVYSAALILPFLCIYHLGSWILRTTYINGADALIVRILNSLSVHSMFGSALVLLAAFTVWQLRTRASWKINFWMLFFTFLESVCFALLLLFAFGWVLFHSSFSAAAKGSGISRMVLYCGAGIYEELLFRAFLLGILMALFGHVFHMKRSLAATTAAILGSLLFAAFHYFGSAGDSFAIGSFVQRTVGGLYFSVLYVTRGFGITAASHAIYDMLIVLG